MDREGLRKQLYEEIHAQFESKLREARRQKSQLEEEMELSEEKWRNERRRLNSEIDRLESALGDAREARRKAAPAKTTKGLDSEEAAQLQAAAEEKLQKASQTWEAEKTKLKAEISRLQSGIAEMLERSNNPLRSAQHEKDTLETQLRDALKAKRQAEDALLAAKNEWDQEKLDLVADSVKSRRGVAAPKAVPKDDRVEQLERQLDEAIRTRDNQLRDAASSKEKLEQELEKSRHAIASLKSGETDTVSRLKVELEEARAELKLAKQKADEIKAAADKERAALEKQLKEAVRTQEKLEAELAKPKPAQQAAGGGAGASAQELEKAQKAIESLKASQAETMTRFKEELEQARAELKLAHRRADEVKTAADKEHAELEKQLKNASKGTSDKSPQSADLAKLKVELQEARKLNEDLERRLAEAGEPVNSDVVAQLRRQYDERLQDMIREKTQLSQELRDVTSLLEAERVRFANGGDGKEGGSGETMEADKINAEVSRVQEMIADIASLIDNPETELSTVIRKNVERAELDAYLKGILFSLGRGKAL
jgi:chromosome segregation ATPase